MRPPRWKGLSLVPLATLVVLLLVAIETRAHDQAGSLGTAASATDYYRITCFDDGSGPPASLVIQVRDSSPGAAPRVSAQMQRGSALASTSDDLAADILASPEIVLDEGAGVYHVLVDKTGAGPKFYQLTYHCWTGPGGTGIHTGSSHSVRQDQ